MSAGFFPQNKNDGCVGFFNEKNPYPEILLTSWFAQGLWILVLGLMCLLGIWIYAVAAIMLEHTEKSCDERSLSD